MVRQFREVTRISFNNQNCSNLQKFRLVKKKIKKAMKNATNYARLTRIYKNC